MFNCIICSQPTEVNRRRVVSEGFYPILKKYFEILQANSEHITEGSFLCESCGKKCINFVENFNKKSNELRESQPQLFQIPQLQQPQPQFQFHQLPQIQPQPQPQSQLQLQQPQFYEHEFINQIISEANLLSTNPNFTTIQSNNIKNVNILELTKTVEEKAPTILKIFNYISNSNNNGLSFPQLISLSMLLKQRNQKCSVIQKVISILLNKGSADKRVFFLFFFTLLFLIKQKSYFFLFFFNIDNRKISKIGTISFL